MFVPKQSWLDRTVRGRAWIPLLGVTLVAIVGLRVEVLKLTSGVGTQIQQAAELQSTNATLRSRVSELSGNQRIEPLAEQMGMVMPGPMDVHFVRVGAGTHVSSAIKGIHSPDSYTFLTSLVAERQADESNASTAAQTSAVGDLASAPSTTSSDSSETDSAATTDPSATTDSATSGDTADSTSAGTTDSTTDPTPDSATGIASNTSADTADGSTSASGTSEGATDLAPSSTGATDTATGESTDGATGDNGTTEATADPSDSPTGSGTTGSTMTSGSASGGTSLGG